MDFSKEERICSELKRISVFFEKIDGNQRAIIQPLLQNAAFMRVTLEDLQEVINSEGVTDEYKNGANQFGVKPSATLQAYNTLVKNYIAVIKTLSQLLPPEKKAAVNKWQPREKTPEEIEAEHQAAIERTRRINEEINRAAEMQRKQASRS